MRQLRAPRSSRRTIGRAASAICAVFLARTPALGAQVDCFPGPASNEARVLAHFAVPIAYGPGGAPAVMAPGDLRFALEVTYVPDVDSATATPTVCRPGKGPENTGLLPGFVRPRVRLGLPGRFALEASWIPPVRIDGVRAHLVSLSIDRVSRIGRAALALRAHATFGEIRGPITCPDRLLATPESECFQGQRSDDLVRPNIYGLDAALGWSWAGGRLSPYVGTGYNRLEPRFRVDFTNAQGSTDRRRVEVELDRIVLFGGVSWRWSSTFQVTGEVYSAPADGATVRLVGAIGR